jgi:hypothetical protein
VSNKTLARTVPLSFATSDRWMELIQASGAKAGFTFWHHLHLGIGLADRFDFDGARQQFFASVALRPTALALRGLAVVETDLPTRWTYYQRAWALAGKEQDPSAALLVQHLAGEVADFLAFAAQLDGAVQPSWVADLRSFLGSLPPACVNRGSYCDSDQVALAALKLANVDGDCDLVLALIGSWPFTTLPIDSGFADFSGGGMWGACVLARQSKQLGRPLTPLERKHALIANPPPEWVMPQNY